jgi:membrane protein CcdC involved in cytochrome C biogenesis
MTKARPRNPFRNEADAFRVLVITVIAGAIVVAVALLAGPLAGFLLALALIAIAAWRAAALFQRWRREGSAPDS